MSASQNNDRNPSRWSDELAATDGTGPSDAAGAAVVGTTAAVAGAYAWGRRAGRRRRGPLGIVARPKGSTGRWYRW
ncbi:hypothetical protein [Streptomyces sp. NPDC050600]|uniref:hypothetical protein n=1 Tax=Streptomyces sp. NPDC050600 TaxID=3157213 RepID=UPI00342B3512